MVKKIAAILAGVVGFVAIGLNSYAAHGDTIDTLYGNVLTNGTFENDVTGWMTDGAASIKRVVDITYDDSAGAAYIIQSNIDYVITPVSLRYNKYYHAEAYVKLKSGTAEARVIIETSDGNLINATGSATVNADGWTRLAGDFVEQSGKDFLPKTREELFDKCKCYIDISGTSEFYLDNLIITAYEENINKNFQAEDPLFGWSGNPQYYKMVPLEKNDQVNNLIEKGLFPDIDNVVQYVTGDCVTPSALVPISTGEEYVVSAWFKINDDVEGASDPCAQIIHAGIPVLDVTGTGYANMSHLRRIVPGRDADDNVIPTKECAGWQYIETTVSMPDNGTVAACDMKVNLAFYNKTDNNGYIQSGIGQGLQFQLAELRVRPKKYMQTFAVSTTKNERNDEHVDGAPLNGYAATNVKNAKVLFNESTYGIDIYNNGLQIGVFDLAGDAAIARNNLNVKGGGRYNVNVWVMPSENVTDTVTAKLQTRVGTKRPKTVVNDVLQVGKWKKLSAGKVEISTRDAEDASVTLSLSGANSGTVYFGGIEIEEVKTPSTPVIDEIRLPDLISGKKGEAILSGKCDNEFSYRYFYLCADSEDENVWQVVKSGNTGLGETVPGIVPEVLLAGKYIKLRVIPIDSTLEMGSVYESNVVRVKEELIIGTASTDIIDSDKIQTKISIENITDAGKAVAVVAGYYNANGEMVATGVDNQVINAGANADFCITARTDGAESVNTRVYILEGTVDADRIPMSHCPWSEVK